MELWQWTWIIVALVVMPLVAILFTKLDLEYDDREPDTTKNIGGAAIVAALWPAVVMIGLAALIFVFPTWYLVTTMTTRHMKRKREAATEREVLARIEAEKKAEDDRIRREIDGPEPEPVELELPHPRAVGRLRKAQNAAYLRANMKQMRANGASHEQIMAFARLARQERLYNEVPPDEIPSTLKRVNWL